MTGLVSDESQKSPRGKAQHGAPAKSKSICPDDCRPADGQHCLSVPSLQQAREPVGKWQDKGGKDSLFFLHGKFLRLGCGGGEFN
jgi:hypothetical protein